MIANMALFGTLLTLALEVYRRLRLEKRVRAIVGTISGNERAFTALKGEHEALKAEHERTIGDLGEARRTREALRSEVGAVRAETADVRRELHSANATCAMMTIEKDRLLLSEQSVQAKLVAALEQVSVKTVECEAQRRGKNRLQTRFKIVLARVRTRYKMLVREARTKFPELAKLKVLNAYYEEWVPTLRARLLKAAKELELARSKADRQHVFERLLHDLSHLGSPHQ